MAAPADGGAARAAVSEPARGPGGYRERYLGVRIPSARALPATAWTFADGRRAGCLAQMALMIRRGRCEG